MMWKHAGLVLLAGVLLPSCTDDVEQAAVTLSDEGALQVLHHPCRGDNVVSALQLRLVQGDEWDAGDDTILWKVVAVDTRTEREVEAFEPGSVPAGYRETVPFDEPIEGAEVVVNVDTRHGGLGSALPFVWGTLEPGTLVSEDGFKSRSGWLKYAIEGCGGT